MGAHGVKPPLSKVQVIAELATPSVVKDVRSLLGLASFYKKFIGFFSGIAAPLNDLTKKGIPKVWGADEEEAFRRLKTTMIKAPIL